MNAKPPETFGLDRLETPIGPRCSSPMPKAFCVRSTGRIEPRMRELLRRQYGAVVLTRQGAAPISLRRFERYFKGDLAALTAIKWRVAGTPFQQKVWRALPKIPAGTTTELRRSWR